MTASLEPLSVPTWRHCGRLGGSSHWRGFAQQSGAEQEQEPGTSSSKASADASGKAEDPAESKEAHSGEGETGKDDPEVGDGKAEAEGPEAGKAEAKAGDAEEPPEAEAEPEELSPVERLRRDLEDFQERSRGKKKELLLAFADFENSKKKFMKERESRRRTATANFARRMVDVYREFEDLPALKVDSSAEKVEGSPCVALQEGVSLTRDLFAAALEKSNVERLPVEPGTPVVNARHEVVGSTQGDGSLPEGSIAEVAEAGWMMDMRSQAPQVLQKAKVKTVRSVTEEVPAQ